MPRIDPDYLAALRAQAAEVRADLEEREANCRSTGILDPIADHENIMAATRPEIVRQRTIVRKTNEDARVLPNDDGDYETPPLTDEQIDIIAQVLAQLRMEFQAAIDDTAAPLRERISALEGQVSTLMAMLSDSNRSIEAVPKLVHSK